MGGIGCEVLKVLGKMPIGTIHILDMDTIEVNTSLYIDLQPEQAVPLQNHPQRYVQVFGRQGGHLEVEPCSKY